MRLDKQVTLIEWKYHVTQLHLIEDEIEKIPKGRMKNRLKRMMKEFWLSVWNYHPDQNENLTEAFERNFKT